MSGDFQNRVRKNLEQTPLAQHPSADALSAYAEHALSAREEKEVLAHLSVCATCRDVVYLSTQAAEAPAISVTSAAAPRRFRWWTWALPATAVLVVASVFLVQGPLFKAAPEREVAKSMQAQLKPVQPSDELASKTEPVTAPKESKPATKGAQPSQKTYALSAPAATPLRESRQVENEAPINLAGGATLNAPAAAAPPPPPPSYLEKDKKLQTAQLDDNAARASSTVEVTSEAQSTTAEVAPSRDRHGYIAMKAAKQRPDTANKTDALKSAPAAGLVANFAAPAWSVTVGGHLQHQVNGAWQPVAVDPAAHFLVVSAIGENIWVGGTNLALYHSADNGSHWERQSIPAASPADIVRLQATSPNDVTLDTSASQSFVTHDGGKTWSIAR